MTFNPQYAESLGAELRRERIKEAENERLARQEPHLAIKVLVILLSRWSGLWDRYSHKYPPITRLPKNSAST